MADTFPITRLRDLPSVDSACRAVVQTGLPTELVKTVVRRELDVARARLVDGEPTDPLERARAVLSALAESKLRPVVNATGILIHTNLGRSPLSAAAVAAVTAAAAGYSNLEYDLITGDRGSRGGYLEQTLAVLCDAPAAAVVNNCAAALVLMVLSQLTADRDAVLISRGELVQIGGGFRVHEILQSAGVRLVEVGATNQTTVDDYRRALGPKIAAILKVHPANFFMDGFVHSPTPAELASLTREAGVRLLEDLGSGAIDGFNAALPAAEPTAARSLKQGVDAVCFSGDKLLGGPQAGIVAGDVSIISAVKKHPLFRATRCDKLVLAGLTATVDEWLAGRDPPVLRMLKTSTDELTTRADALAVQSKVVSVGTGVGMIGGGALPRVQIPSVTLDVRVPGLAADATATRFRAAPTPVIGYVRDGVFKLDLRTVFPEQDGLLLQTLRTL